VTHRALHIPEKVRRHAEVLGQSRWLAELRDRVAEIERRWGIAVGDTTSNATEAFVALARTAEGHDAALKMVIPGIDPSRQQIRILQSAGGRGYVKLLRADMADNVLLLERLGPQLFASGLSDDEQIAVICHTLHEAWTQPPEGPAFITGAAKAVELGAIIESRWSKYGEPCSAQTYGLCLEFAERRHTAFDPAVSVLVHGDAHAWNTLAAPGSATGYKFVDPDGAFAERAFDLAIPMREWGAVLPDGDLLALGRQRCRLLEDLTGVAAQPIWEWSLLQLVSNALLLKDIAAEEPAAVSFAMADAFAAGGLE
jgi:streptomycin 6-kinase